MTVSFEELRKSHEEGLLDDAQLGIFLKKLSSQCSDIFRYFSIGLSTQGRQMWTARLTDNPDVNEFEPEFLYVGNIHGDETFGRELLIHLVLNICDKYYAGDVHTRWLVQETDIYVVFSANPDGYNALTRFNYNGVDLNRNFPDQVLRRSVPLQDETRNLMAFLQRHSFSLGANLHAGDLVCNYPWDDSSTGHLEMKIPSLSPDEELYQHICSVYSRSHGSMSRSTRFSDGITNGAAFYSMYGGLQDYAYAQLGMMHVTLELGFTKNPPVSKLSRDWVANSEAMYAFIEQVHFGVRGHVTCSCGGHWRREPANASLSFISEGGRVPSPPPLAQVIHTWTNPDLGSYHRVLLPGTYTVTVHGCGGATLAGQRVVVPNMTAGHPSADASPAITVDFNLHQRMCPLQAQVKAEFVSSGIPLEAVGLAGAGLFTTAVPWCIALLVLPMAAYLLGKRRRHRFYQDTILRSSEDSMAEHMASEDV